MVLQPRLEYAPLHSLFHLKVIHNRLHHHIGSRRRPLVGKTAFADPRHHCIMTGSTFREISSRPGAGFEDSSLGLISDRHKSQSHD
jgi:hypothetical protein